MTAFEAERMKERKKDFVLSISCFVGLSAFE
jgi:hypothetical protein